MPIDDDTITALSRRRIELARQAGSDWRFSESLKELSEEMAQEYAGRALVELIQNGHDALGSGGRGRIGVLLDLHTPGPAGDAEHQGTLYVANDGAGFTEANFREIIEFGLSGKGPGEGIGNKGLGFRSVLQLTDWPEIYSRSAPDSAGFDGFCFRFATPDDVRALLKDPEAASWVIDKVSPLALPVPAAVTDPVVEEFAAQGFSTVVRLALRKENAVTAALAQVAELVHSEAPLLLFLDRITALTVETLDGAGRTERHVLTRSERPPAWSTTAGVGGIAEVDLGEAGRYLLARGSVSADALHDAIERSIAGDELHRKWRNWQGDTWVGIALPLDRDLDAGLMYTFLPMGPEAPAPFPGHAHAPFFTKMARLHLNETVALNDFLLDELATLCLNTARHLRAHAPRSLAVRLVPDTVCWARPDRIDAAAHGALADETVVPLAGGGEDGWGCLRESFAWPDDGIPWKVMTATALAACGAPVVDPEVGAARQGRIDDLYTKLLGGRCMRAGARVKAEWAEHLARTLHPGTAAPVGVEWADFYDDLAQAFRGEGAAELRGRAIVLDHSGELRAPLGGEPGAGHGREESVFFAPEGAGTDAAARVPSGLRALRRRLVFTHPGIAWRPAGRGFFEGNRLIRRYQPDRVLDALRELLAHRPSHALCRDALVFVHHQYPHLSQPQRSRLAAVGFRVPLKDGGWAKAADCLMSPGWGTEGARLLARFLDSGGDAVPELAALRGRWISAPDDWPVRVSDPALWREFLLSVGVRDGLPLEEVTLPAAEGRSLAPGSLARRFPLTSAVTRAWASDVRRRWSSGNHPQTPYAFDRAVPHLPGIEAVAKLDGASRRLFASLVLNGLRTWPQHALTVGVRRPSFRHQRTPDLHTWPTPVSSALRHLPWLPVEDGAEGSLSFVAPGRAWYGDDTELPPFVPQLPLPVRRMLGDKRTLERLRWLGLCLWENPADAAAAVRDLGELLADGQVPDRFAVRFKRYYRQAWQHTAASGSWPWDDDETIRLAVTQSNVLSVHALPGTDDEEEEVGELDAGTVYVVDEAAPLKESLVELAGHPVLVTAPEHGKDIARLLKRHGVDLRVLSTTEFQVRTRDGRPITPAGDQPLLTDGREWLLVLVALVMELKSGAFTHRSEQRMRELLDLLHLIRIVRTEEVDILVAGCPVTPPPTARALALPHPEHPTVVVWAGNDGRCELQACAPALAQLLHSPTLHDALELALTKVRQQLGTPPAELPDVDDRTLALALDTTEEKVAEVRRGLTGELTTLVRRLRPVLVCTAGPGRAAEVDEALRGARSEEALLDVIDRYRTTVRTPAPELLARTREHRSLADLRDALGLDFTAFNAALEAIGPPCHPLTHPELHERAFDEFVHTHTDAILDRLREHYAPLAAAGADVSRYVQARHFEKLAPDPAWLPLFRVPPPEIMRGHVSAWLRAQGVEGDDWDDPQNPTLKPVAELRVANATGLDALVPELVPLVQAWCRAHGVPVPPAWLQAPLMHAKDGLDRSGLADLSLLTEDQLLQSVFRDLGRPPGMPLTADAAALGLSPANLAAAASRRPGGSAAPTPTITIGGAEIPVGRDQLARIAELAHQSVDEALLAQPGTVHLTSMAPVTRLRSTSPAGAGASSAQVSRPTDAQREAIGLVGEVVARAWLRRRHRIVHWRSSYAALLGSPEDAAAASNSHGYDFEVPWRNTSLLYEVKALSDAWTRHELEYEFDLGASEHHAATAHAATTRYRILLITSALDPTSRQLFELPNPLSPRGRDCFRIVGHGLRLRCAPGR
ncbi:sacsin N-terminal ATP-binding-like domain-containing protein [Streptomyces sp. NPDC006384]|uniref:sacsin N-terminal ATP-binding-like domain-containing protein n=1 Tax=Streptomyces sp. NPDC006384 TaxID=3364745 RepID=UPI0036C2EDE3